MIVIVMYVKNEINKNLDHYWVSLTPKLGTDHRNFAFLTSKN